MAKVAALVLFGLTGGIGWAISRARPRSQLRQPTREEFDAVAEPLGDLASRHLPAAIGTKDLEDLAAAGVAVRDYIVAGPLIIPRTVDPGVPTDLDGME